MSESINFESGVELEKIRQEKKKLRELALEKAQRNFEKEKKFKKKQLDSILPEIHRRVEEESIEIEAIKHKKEKKKKSRKNEKHKKSKKQSKSSSDSEELWVEKTFEETPVVTAPHEKIERQSWMVSDEFENIFGQSKLDSNKKTTREEKRVKENEEIRIKEQSLELNPYWKDGGSGLPTDQSEAKRPAGTMHLSTRGISGDGGLSWWRSALHRCTQMADQAGCTVQEVAADRYGSLEALMVKIREAEKYVDSNRAGVMSSRSNKSRVFRKPGQREEGSGGGGGARRRDGDGGRRRVSGDTNDAVKGSEERNGYRDRKDGDGLIRKYSSRDVAGRDSGRAGWRKSDKEGDCNNERRGEGRIIEREKVQMNEREMERINEGDEMKKNEGKCDTKKDLKSSNLPSDSPSSSDESDESAPRDNTIEPTTAAVSRVAKKLTAEEKNKLASKMLKAEMMGDVATMQVLKLQLEAAVGAEEGREDGEGRSREKEIESELLMVVNKQGFVRPFEGVQGDERRRKKKIAKVDSHEEGKRVRYLHDDDQHSLKSLMHQEKHTSSQDDCLTFARLSGKLSKVEDETVDDEWLREQPTTSYIDSHAKQTAVIEQRRLGRKLDSCPLCFDHCLKHLVVSIGRKVYLSLPSHKSMVEGHCIIAPLHHVSQSTVCDEDVLEEIITYKRQLLCMFQTKQQQAVLFMETCRSLKGLPHLSIECIPLPQELADLAPIYFSKAINDSGAEWASNKKLVKVKGVSITSSIPPGFPFFHVSFGLEGGYVHVIEDEAAFPHYFGREVIGGMMELESSLWRKPHKDSFEAQRSKVLTFSKTWKSFDHTRL